MKFYLSALQVDKEFISNLIHTNQNIGYRLYPRRFDGAWKHIYEYSSRDFFFYESFW